MVHTVAGKIALPPERGYPLFDKLELALRIRRNHRPVKPDQVFVLDATVGIVAGIAGGAVRAGNSASTLNMLCMKFEAFIAEDTAAIVAPVTEGIYMRAFRLVVACRVVLDEDVLVK